jgi:hypothetical protein
MDNEKKMISENRLDPIDIIKNGGFKIEVDGEEIEYFLEPHLSVERYKMMQKFELEMTYATTFKKLYDQLNQVYDTLNKCQFADSSVKIRDLIEGCHRLDDENNFPAIIKYASLMLNTDKENRKVFDERQMKEKIEIWNNAGVPIQCFFAVALHSVNGLMESFKENTRNISKS